MHLDPELAEEESVECVAGCACKPGYVQVIYIINNDSFSPDARISKKKYFILYSSREVPASLLWAVRVTTGAAATAKGTPSRRTATHGEIYWCMMHMSNIFSLSI